ncbi:MAG TPA: TetR/AcrR family transcriptional regulator [Thermodesulfobacteriota bacterium]|nr:TetR/AcrR family transcriptional regulator [Thermodesulfobacteriota bacterium]
MKHRMSGGDRREQILHGAMKLFAEKGFQGTTTRELAGKLKISEALMFKYFPSKEALYRAIIRKRTDGSEEMFFPNEAVQAKNDREVFRSIASYLISKNTEDPVFMRLIHYSALEGHDLSRMFFETHAMEKTKLLSDYIRQRVKEGGFRKVSPLLAARAFIAMALHHVQSVEIYGMKDLARFPQKDVVDTIVDIFLKGLAGPAKKNGSGKK